MKLLHKQTEYQILLKKQGSSLKPLLIQRLQWSFNETLMGA